MRTSSRNLAVLLFDEVELLDFAGAIEIASVAGRHWNWRPFRILTVAAEAGLIETRNQLRVEAKWSWANCPPVEILLIPGGYGARRAAKNAELLAWCAHQCQAAERVLLVGAGAAIAGAAGQLSGVEIAVRSEDASWLRNEDWLKSASPPVMLQTDKFAVNSGKFLSCAHGAGSSKLGLEVVRECLGASTAAKIFAEFLSTGDSTPVSSTPQDVKITER